MEAIADKYRKGIGKKESRLLLELAQQNKPIFTAAEAKEILGEDPYSLLYQLKRKKWVLPLKGGLYAIVPLEIGAKGAESFIVHDFVVASFLTNPYYIGMWSALNYHGFSDQIPSAVFICTPRAKKSIKVPHVEFVFVQLSSKKFMGMEKTFIEGKEVFVSDKNKTIVDCLDHPEHAGGIDEIARAIFFNHEEIDFAQVRSYALKMSNVAIFKRLGFILDSAGLLDKHTGVLKGIKLTKGYPALDKLGPNKGRYSEKWKLFINADLNPKRWMY